MASEIYIQGEFENCLEKKGTHEIIDEIMWKTFLSWDDTALRN